MKGITFNAAPKHKAFEVVDVHTGTVIGVYPTRAEANNHKTKPEHRVRGSYAELKRRQKKPVRRPAVKPQASRDRTLPGKARIRARRAAK